MADSYRKEKMKKRRIIKTVIIFLLMTVLMACSFWNNADENFQRDSEELVVSMVTAGKYHLDVRGNRFGLGWLRTETVPDAYLLYQNGDALKTGYTLYTYNAQIGLHGWAGYLLGSAIPSPVAAFRLACCLLLGGVLSGICMALYKKYGFLFACCFYAVSLFSARISVFASNLYWMEFMWFLPMLLGLICLNHLNMRFWLYPLFYLAIFLKCACGYEYITVIMLNGILFLAAEWLYVFKTDKARRKILFTTIIHIGVICLLAFITVFALHAYMRGSGNMQAGIEAIFKEDVLRRTFGNPADFDGVFTASLKASVWDVLKKYLWDKTAGKWALAITAAAAGMLLYQKARFRTGWQRNAWLFILSFLFCISWFVLGKSHSYIHTHINDVMLYLGYMQIGIYILVAPVLRGAAKTCLRVLQSKKNRA